MGSSDCTTGMLKWVGGWEGGTIRLGQGKGWEKGAGSGGLGVCV